MALSKNQTTYYEVTNEGKVKPVSKTEWYIKWIWNRIRKVIEELKNPLVHILAGCVASWCIGYGIVGPLVNNCPVSIAYIIGCVAFGTLYFIGLVCRILDI